MPQGKTRRKTNQPQGIISRKTQLAEKQTPSEDKNRRKTEPVARQIKLSSITNHQMTKIMCQKNTQASKTDNLGHNKPISSLKIQDSKSNEQSSSIFVLISLFNQEQQ
ncbi:unnamed protein product [Diamesa serratosioi]